MVLARIWEEMGHLAPLTLGRLDPVLMARLLIVLILSGAIGRERSAYDRASGFRPHILVGVSSCLMTMAGAYGFSDIVHAPSYVVSGIGVLGAGALPPHGTSVRRGGRAGEGSAHVQAPAACLFANQSGLGQRGDRRPIVGAAVAARAGTYAVDPSVLYEPATTAMARMACCAIRPYPARTAPSTRRCRRTPCVPRPRG